MKKWIFATVLGMLALPAMAQRTNELGRTGFDRGDGRWGERGDRKYMDRSVDLTPEQRAEREERRLQLMEKTLDEIGVTQEQRDQIAEIQKNHKETMKATSRTLEETRERLSELEKSGASREEIFEAIDEVSNAQSAQMKALIRNRMEIESVLGKEKYKQFMDAARSQYRNHGRRGGYGMPPRPGLSPVPEEDEKRTDPPKPPETSSAKAASAPLA